MKLTRKVFLIAIILYIILSIFPFALLTFAGCGNGEVELSQGEECEYPGSSVCDANCKKIPCENCTFEAGYDDEPTCDFVNSEDGVESCGGTCAMPENEYCTQVMGGAMPVCGCRQKVRCDMAMLADCSDGKCDDTNKVCLPRMTGPIGLPGPRCTCQPRPI